jgi:cobalt-zinc-cadmium efflux system protein
MKLFHEFYHLKVVKPEGMLALAVLGIIVNAVAAYRLSKNDGLNSQMVMYHMLEDLLGWIAVLIVSVILLFKPWFILDSILSILIALIILRGVYKNLLKVGMIFLQKFPDDIEINKIKQKVLSLALVEDVHQIKGWSIDNQTYYLRFHVLIPEETKMKEVDELKVKIKQVLEHFHVEYSTIEFESKKH